MRLAVVHVILLMSIVQNTRCSNDSKWNTGLQSLLKNCPLIGWDISGHEDIFKNFRSCVQKQALAAVEAMLMDDVIPIVDGIDLINFASNKINSTHDETNRQEENHASASHSTNWSDIFVHRLKDVFRTHLVKIDVDNLTNNFILAMESFKSSENSHAGESRRRHRRRHQVMPFMMMGLLLMGSILIPMGFQFLAVLGGKALILAKMALILSSIQGLKRIATNGVNYGLYHAPNGDGWHERSQQIQTPPPPLELPYPMYSESFP